jgi:hypothetical protein
MVLVYKKNKKSLKNTIIGGSFTEVASKEKDQSKLDKLKNFSIINRGPDNVISPTQEKLNKFVNLRLN